MKYSVTTLLPALVLGLTVAGVEGKELTWIPSLSLDQRFDDNYRLRSLDSDSVSATRLIGNLDFNTKSEVSRLAGLLRVDALLNVSEEASDELSSNQLGFLEARTKRPRSEYAVKLNFKQDTPNRDIAADITDLGAIASEVGTEITQDQNVDRKRLEFNPSISFNLSRRTELEFGYNYTNVTHATPSCSDVLATQFFALRPEQRPASPLDLGVFTPDELDDFQEHLFSVSLKHKLSVLDSFTTALSFSQFVSDEEAPGKFEASLGGFEAFKFIDQECRSNSGELIVARNLRLETGVDTARFTVGYDRKLSETLEAGGLIGYYVADSKTFSDDPAFNQPGTVDPSISLFQQEESNGFLFNASLTKKTAVTSYTGRIGVELFPSSAGDLVESFELVGNLTRTLGPRTKVNFRIRAYEPTELEENKNAVGDIVTSKFSRRYLSLEPKIIWNFSRTLTLAASYRYRREKLRDETGIAQSNAVLFSVKYTPPSKLADLENQ